MKIAVYGDSFADERNIFYPNNNYSWSNCLRNKGYDVTNYGRCASSLMYSYKKFMNTYKEYDKIIFLVTGMARFEVKGLPEFDSYIVYGILDSLSKRENYNDTQREIIQACYMYYKYILDDEKEGLFETLLLKELRNLRPDALFLPCFKDSMNQEENIIDLNYFSDVDLEYFNLKDRGPEDRRYCHMNESNNQMLADKLDIWIQTNKFTLSKDDAVNPTNTSMYYFNV